MLLSTQATLIFIIIGSFFYHSNFSLSNNLIIWSNPDYIFNMPGVVVSPVLQSDPSGTLHLLWVTQSEDNPDAIYYAKHSNNWSFPIDIFTGKRISHLDVSIDANWNLHLVWSDGGLYYSKVNLIYSDNIRSWSISKLIDENSVGKPNIRISPDNSIHVIYSTLENIFGLEYISSFDSGDSWSVPSTIVYPDSEHAITQSSLEIDNSGGLHAVYSQVPLPDGYPPNGISYIQSNDNGYSWSNPIEIADGYYSDPTIISTVDSRVIIVWSGSAAIRGRYSRISQDRGNTWGEITEINPGLAGLSSPSPMTKDGDDNIHLAINSDSPEAIMYSCLKQNIWSPLENISRTYAQEGEHIAAVPSIAVSNGNLLNVVYVEEEVGLNHVFATLDIEPIPTKLPPSPIPTALSTQTIRDQNPSVTPTENILSYSTIDDSTSSNLDNNFIPIIIPAITFTIIFSIVLLVRRKIKM